MKSRSIKVTVVVGLVALLVCLPAMAQQQRKSDKGSRALQEREKAMAQLAADSKQALDRLKGLTSEQKNAVIALMAISRASGAYESRFLRKDDPSLRALYGELRQFSPAYRAPASFSRSWMTTCFDQTVACLSAQKKCREGGSTDDQCDRSYAVIEACGNEMACITSEFLKLHKGIPTILGGRDPWPPQPFPY
jgi:hypothetical protein